MTFPNLELEQRLLKTSGQLVCIDEVGRGAIAGPVVVAATIFDNNCSTEIPAGLKDSKLIAEPKRAGVAELASNWLQSSVGLVHASEVDSIGINEALKKAALNAIAELNTSGPVLLDGKHNWMGTELEVITQIKADQKCAAVSAASIIAKHYRDEIMRELDTKYPAYHWRANKGYASESHIMAIREYGPTEIHRKSWLTRILNSEQTLF